MKPAGDTNGNILEILVRKKDDIKVLKSYNYRQKIRWNLPKNFVWCCMKHRYAMGGKTWKEMS